MRERGYVEGTSGVMYVHKKDERRHRKRCVHYRIDGSCGYMSKCGGAAHCQFYEEERIDKKDRLVSVPIKNKVERVYVNSVEDKVDESVKVFSGVQTIRLDQIVVPKKYLRLSPDSKKVETLYKYYKSHKRLDKPIYVSIKNGMYYLEDKYLRYYVAKELGLKRVRARIGTYSESVMYDRLQKVGRSVKHKKYGIGTIVENDGKYVTVLFDKGEDIRFDLDICIKNNILL